MNDVSPGPVLQFLSRSLSLEKPKPSRACQFSMSIHAEENLVIVTRIRLPLVLSLVLFAAACAHTTQPAAMPEPAPPRPVALAEQAGGCPPAVNRPEAPMVCVDDTGDRLHVSPETVYAYDVHPNDKAPVNLTWFTKSGGGDLRIEFADEHCVGRVWCNPNSGLCQAKTLPLEGKDESAPCKYDVWMEGGRQPRIDPYVVIRDCCG